MQRDKGKEPLREAVKWLDERLWHQLEEVWRLAEEGIHDAQIQLASLCDDDSQKWILLEG